jgi:hypothetical protein
MCRWGYFFSWYHLCDPEEPGESFNDRLARIGRTLPPLRHEPDWRPPVPDLSPPTRFKLRGFVATTRNVQGYLMPLMNCTGWSIYQPQGSPRWLRRWTWRNQKIPDPPRPSKKRKRDQPEPEFKPRTDRNIVFKLINRRSILVEFIVPKFKKVRFTRFKSQRRPKKVYARRHVEQMVVFTGVPKLLYNDFEFEHGYRWKVTLSKSMGPAAPRKKLLARMRPKTKAKRMRYWITVKLICYKML